MVMTENDALGKLKAKLTCMQLEDLSFIEKGCDRNCDACEYCYAQGTRAESKTALLLAIDALKEIQQYRAIGTVSEFRENKNFLEFLYNHIQPNEMEQYLAMYHAKELKGE